MAGVNKKVHLLVKTFDCLKSNQILYLCPVIPWAIDDESFRLAKELFNKMLNTKINNGLTLKEGGSPVQWIETKSIYEKPFHVMCQDLRRPGDQVHYTYEAMREMVSYIFRKIK